MLAYADHNAIVAPFTASRGAEDELDQWEEGEEACGEQRAESVEKADRRAVRAVGDFN